MFVVNSDKDLHEMTEYLSPDEFYERLQNRRVPPVDPVLGYSPTSAMTTVDLRELVLPLTTPAEYTRLLQGKMPDGLRVQMEITPFLAEYFLLNAWFKQQRPTGKNQLSDLIEAQNEGQFLNWNDMIIFGILDDKVYHIAGRHRFTAQIFSKKTFAYHVLFKHFTSYEDMKIAYTHTHTRKAITSREQNMVGLDMSLWKVPESFVHGVMAAIRALVEMSLDPQSGFRKDQLRDQAALYGPISERYKKSAELLYSLYGHDKVMLEGMSRAGRLGFFLVAARHQPEAVSQFFTDLTAYRAENNPDRLEILSKKAVGWMDRLMETPRKPILPSVIKKGGYSTGMAAYREQTVEMANIWFRFRHDKASKSFELARGVLLDNPVKGYAAYIVVDGAPMQSVSARKFVNEQKTSKAKEKRQAEISMISRSLNERRNRRAA